MPPCSNTKFEINEKTKSKNYQNTRIYIKSHKINLGIKIIQKLNISTKDESFNVIKLQIVMHICQINIAQFCCFCIVITTQN